jgi:hypothetical protein
MAMDDAACDCRGAFLFRMWKEGRPPAAEIGVQSGGGRLHPALNRWSKKLGGDPSKRRPLSLLVNNNIEQ